MRLNSLSVVITANKEKKSDLNARYFWTDEIITTVETKTEVVHKCLRGGSPKIWRVYTFLSISSPSPKEKKRVTENTNWNILITLRDPSSPMGIKALEMLIYSVDGWREIKREKRRRCLGMATWSLVVGWWWRFKTKQGYYIHRKKYRNIFFGNWLCRCKRLRASYKRFSKFLAYILQPFFIVCLLVFFRIVYVGVKGLQLHINVSVNFTAFVRLCPLVRL